MIAQMLGRTDSFRRFFVRFAVLALLAAVMQAKDARLQEAQARVAARSGRSARAAPVYGYRVVATYPHSTDSYTEGFF